MNKGIIIEERGNRGSLLAKLLNRRPEVARGRRRGQRMKELEF